MLLHSSPGALPFPRLLRCRNFPLFRRKIHKPPPPPPPSRCVCLSIGTDTIAEIAQNKVIVGAVISAAIGQFSKPFTSVLLYGNKFEFKISSIISSGGFPSTHSSAVVATATSLGLERGFSDAIFGLAVVYAGITMYDAQGVRREVGTHAKLLNKNLPKTQGNTFPSSDANNLVNCSSGKPPLGLESPDPLFLSEPSNMKPINNISLQRKISDRTTSTLVPSTVTAEVKEGSGDIVHIHAPLKESIGHTEVEVLAGAILGFLVSLVVHI